MIAPDGRPAPSPLYRDARPIDRRSGRRPARTHDDRREGWPSSAARGCSSSPPGPRSTAGAPALLEHGLGQVTRVSGASNVASRRRRGELANEIQRHLVEHTRLGIPAIVHEEVCAGLMARGATVFPQPIGLASTWDPSLDRTDGDHRAHRDARDRRPPGSVAGARRVPRSALGPDRRDVRRGPAPRAR